ncbi:hypothetical protein RA268_27885 [Pseudomonas syringae pv. tagetis]
MVCCFGLVVVSVLSVVGGFVWGWCCWVLWCVLCGVFGCCGFGWCFFVGWFFVGGWGGWLGCCVCRFGLWVGWIAELRRGGGIEFLDGSQL